MPFTYAWVMAAGLAGGLERGVGQMLDWTGMDQASRRTGTRVSLSGAPAGLLGMVLPYGGPERRSGALPLQHLLQQMLDEVDYGMLLLTDEVRVVHANKAATRDLDDGHPLQLLGQEVRTRRPQDVVPLREALAAAAQRGLRKLLHLGDKDLRCTVAVVPLPAVAGEPLRPVLLLLGKRRVCEELSVDWYARSHHLTGAETQVLKGLCAGLQPLEIAGRQGVALSTVRTQIGSIRAKTGADSIRALVQQVAQLPPMVNALAGQPQPPLQPLAA
jgi:DNA-binding CsgD family transcriptional regulator